LKVKANIRREGKVEKVMKFAKKIKKMQEKARVVLEKVQEKMK